MNHTHHYTPVDHLLAHGDDLLHTIASDLHANDMSHVQGLLGCRCRSMH
jgi:hypothetical protein